MRHFFVRPHEQKSPIRQRSEARRTPRQYDKPMTLQFEIPDNLRPEQAVDVAGSRDFESRPQFLCYHTPSDQFSAFQDEHLSSCPSQISSSDKSVVARADNY